MTGSTFLFTNILEQSSLIDWEFVGEQLVAAAFVLLMAFLLVKFIRGAIKRIRKRGKASADLTHLNFIENSIGFIVYFFAGIFVISLYPPLKHFGTALFAGAGVIAAVVGFASQSAFSNIISGLFILVFKPFRVGDVVEFGNNLRGKVSDITLRHTVIKDLQNRSIIIPNNVISNETIINSSINDERIRKFVHFGISYDSNVDMAMKIIREEIRKHPHWIDGRTEENKNNGIPEIEIKVIEWADSAVVLRAYAWVPNSDKGVQLEFDVLKTTKEKFELEGIEIPYPHMVVNLNK